MSRASIALLVRFTSSLPRERVLAIVEDRAPEFAALDGLVQKYYLEDPDTGDVAGLYLWDSPESLAAFRDSELAASIGRAYEATSAPRIEAYRVLKHLRDPDG